MIGDVHHFGLTVTDVHTSAEWVQPEPRYTTGVFAKYASTVGSAAEGART